MVKYSLWFMPEDEHYKKYKKIIIDFSNKYNSPNFEPHVTLLGNITREDTLLRAGQLVHLLRPFKIKLTKVSYSDKYFRCVFLLAEKSKELMRANDIARRFFYMEKDPPFMPHLSLLYGDFSKKIKKEVITELGNIEDEFKVDKLFVNTASSDTDTKDWKIVKALDFRLIAGKI